MGTYYDTEVERQKRGDTAVNTVLPILAAIETIATAKASRGQNVGTSTLNLLKDTQARREAALERATRADDAQFNKNLNIGESARASKRLALEQSQGEREAKRFEQEQKDAGDKANTRKATIDRLLGIPNEYDEKTNTVTRSGVPGVTGLTEADKAAIQSDPFKWLEDFQKNAPIRKANEASVDPEVMDLLGKITDVASYNSAKTRIASEYGADIANKLMGPSYRTAMPMEKFSLYEGGVPGGPVGGYVVTASGEARPIVPVSGPAASRGGHGGMGGAPSGPQLSKEEKDAVDGESAIPGLKPIQGIKITKDSVKAVKDAYAKFTDFTNQLGQYKALIKKYGAEAVGEHADELDAYATGMAMTLKELNNLGVLNGPDLALLQKQIPAASGLMAKGKSLAYGAVGADPFTPRLNTLEAGVSSKFNSMAKANGFQLDTPKPPAETPPVMDKKAMATQALNDPEATPEEKAAAKRILGL